MANLFKLEAGKLNAFNARLAKAGLTAELADEVQLDRTGALADIMVNALKAYLCKIREAKLFGPFDASKTSDEVLAEMDRQGFRPATIEEFSGKSWR